MYNSSVLWVQRECSTMNNSMCFSGTKPVSSHV